MSPDTDRELAALFDEAPASSDDAALALAIVRRVDADQRRRRVLLSVALLAGVVIAAVALAVTRLVPIASVAMQSAAAQLSLMMGDAATHLASGSADLEDLLSERWFQTVLSFGGGLAALGAMAGAAHRTLRG